MGVKQTKHLGKQYSVKWKGYNQKEATWVRPSHWDHLLEMVDKFEWERKHELGQNKKQIKIETCEMSPI
jgi:hypothetical protein